MMNVVLVALLLTASQPLEADPAAPSATEAPVAKEKKICKRQAVGVTSRMSKSVCRTAAEWEEAARNKTTASDLERLGRK